MQGNAGFRPLVQTPTLKAMLSAAGDDALSIADEFPGFDVSICYLNLPHNFEDCMVVSKKFVDLGGFSSYSLCRYLLPGDEHVS